MVKSTRDGHECFGCMEWECSDDNTPLKELMNRTSSPLHTYKPPAEVPEDETEGGLIIGYTARMDDPGALGAWLDKLTLPGLSRLCKALDFKTPIGASKVVLISIILQEEE